MSANALEHRRQMVSDLEHNIEIGYCQGDMKMNQHRVGRWSSETGKRMLVALGFGLICMLPMQSNAAAPMTELKPESFQLAQVTNPSQRALMATTELAPKMELALGQSHLLRLPVGTNLKRVKVEDDKIVQIEVLSPREVLLQGKTAGTTVVILWDSANRTSIVDVSVVSTTAAADAASLRIRLAELFPNEKEVQVSTVANSLVLAGTVSDSLKVDKMIAMAEAYAGKDKTKKVVNMLRVSAPQQVMLEVKMAEISKNLLDQLGVDFNFSRSNGGVAYSLLNGFGLAEEVGGKLVFTNGDTVVSIDAEKKDTLIKVLAEPNIIAISGQEGSFLAGGKFYISVPQAGIAAGAVTLEEKDFGVGLKFTPTVLENGLINLRVAPEVTELLKSTIQVGVGTSPTLSTRRVSTTVQLRDGQSFAIAGLIKSNIVEDIRRFPVLGEIPILGALFRSSEFRDEKTELLFVVTPRLVKPLPSNYALPTDHFNQPSRTEFFLEGKLEGQPTQSIESSQSLTNPVATPTEPRADDGFEMR